MRALPLAAATALLAVSARAGWFGGYRKYTSPQGDFEVDMPKGWVAEQYLGEADTGRDWYEPAYVPRFDKKFHHADTIFRDPTQEEHMLVVRYRQYKQGLTDRDGLMRYTEDLADYVKTLRDLAGADLRSDAVVKWSDPAGGDGVQIAVRPQAAYQESREQQPCNVFWMYGSGLDPILKTCGGNVQYHTLYDRNTGLYDLIYPSSADAPKDVMDHYRRMLASFKVLRPGGPDAPAQPTAAITAPPPPAAASAPAAGSDVDNPSYHGKPRPDDFALVVGVEDYDRLPKATNAAHDADAVRKHLLALGFPERNIIVLKNRDAVRSRLAAYLEEWLPKNTDDKSTVVFYYSGHGAPDLKTGAAYLVPSDGDAEFLQSTAFPVKKLYADLAKLPAKRVIVALDACFSGAGGRSVIAQGARPLVAKPADLSPEGKISVLAAASGEQITGSLDSQGHGLFTYYLLKGLADGKRSTAALLDYAKPRVEDEARRQNREQTPVMLGMDMPL